MSLFTSLNVALSGLTATMTQMQVAANNIANASNEGYTRKTAVTQAVVLGNEGGGTQVMGFSRASNDALAVTMNLAISDYGLRSTQSKYLEQLQSILGANNSTNPPLSDSISKFAAAWRQLESAPESNVSQSQVIQAASDLVAVIQKLAASVDDLNVQCSAEIDSTLRDLNANLVSIADLNKRISLGLGVDQDVGSLEDQRDLLIQKVASVMNIKVMQRERGQIALYTTGGYTLIDGDAQRFYYDGTKVYSALDPDLSLNNALAGGKLQALVNFRATAATVSADPATNVIQKVRSQISAIVDAFTSVSLGPPQSFASSYNGVAEASQSNCITFRSKFSGTIGNGVTVAISAGTAPGTRKATIHMEGGTDEIFDNITGTGNDFWVNLADAINNGQAGPPAVSPSRYITATAGSGATAPAALYTLSGGLGNVANGTASSFLMNNGIASLTILDNCLNLRALAAGADGNNISITIENGSGAGLYTVTITNGTVTETYEDIDDGGGGNAFWINLADAINNGGGSPPAPPSTLVSATAGTGVSAPVLTTYSLTGGGDTMSTCLSLYALNSGINGNNISVTLSAGTNAGTYKVTISAPSYMTEVYDNIDNSGNGLWANIADAINGGQAGPPPVSASLIVMAVAGDGESLPSTPKSFVFTGGTNELLTSFFTGSGVSSFAVNSSLMDGSSTIKLVSASAVSTAFNSSGRTFSADGLQVTDASYETLTTSILTGFQQATTSVNALYTSATGQQDYLKQRMVNETGVNVDTETVTLTTLQNAYAASAHVIQIINKLFDILESL